MTCAGLLLVLWVARAGLATLGEFVPTVLPGLLEADAWHGILAGGFLAFFAFIGFEDMVNVAEEVRDPRRNLPLAILLALLVTAFFYMSVSLVAVLSVPALELAGSDAPLALVYSRSTGSPATAIGVISVLAVVNGALIQIIMASRILYGMARQSWLPPSLGRVSPLTHTPLLATVLVTGMVLVLAWRLPLVALAELTSSFILVVFCLVNLSLWLIKRRGSEPQPVRSWPHWVPLTGFLLSAGMLAFRLLSAALSW